MNELPTAVAELVGAPLPRGYIWGLKTLHQDRTANHGYAWGPPGTVHTATRVNRSNRTTWATHPCDGLAIGLSWEALSYSAIPARHMILVAFRQTDILGAYRSRVRVREAVVVRDVTAREAVTASAGHLYRANLAGADLGGINLHGADATWTVLANTNLADANLSEADFGNSDLRGANLSGANVHGTNFVEADLAGAVMDRITGKAADHARAIFQAAGV